MHNYSATYGHDKKISMRAFLLLAAFVRALGTYRNAAIAGPIFFGLISLILGADTNWDLQNYHLYNAYALLNGKLDIDLAPAGFQTYFNPMLDVPYYLAMQYLPPRVVGFLMGAMHGLNFVLLLGICRITLSNLSIKEKTYVPVLLALAGCLTVNFLSEIGSTMGDDTTALFCMASILVVLISEQRVRQTQSSGWVLLLIAGVFMGMGVGLKLTNAPYAVAVCVGLFAFSFPLPMRIRFAAIYGIGVLIGTGCMNGYWFYTMWVKFGNPLFPQFNNIFQNPLAASVAVGDTSWLPKSIWQQIFWPFIISSDAQKVGQIAIRQIIWAMVYLLFIALLVKTIFLGKRNALAKKMSPPERFVIATLVVGFFVWMKLFSIYRYLVPMDLLAPLAIFILCKALLPYAAAKRLAGIFIVVATLVVLLGGTRTWWHEPWGEKLLHAEVPVLADPSRTTVLMVEGDPPWAWLAIVFPVEVAFIQIHGNFPQGPGYAEHVKKIIFDRSGPTFAQFSGSKDVAAEKENAIREQADRLGITKTTARCDALRWVVEKLNLRAAVNPVMRSSSEVACQLEVKSRGAKRDVELDNRIEREKALVALKTYGLTISEQSCTLHRAGIASSVRLYQWCPVTQIAKE